MVNPFSRIGHALSQAWKSFVNDFAEGGVAGPATPPPPPTVEPGEPGFTPPKYTLEDWRRDDRRSRKKIAKNDDDGRRLQAYEKVIKWFPYGKYPKDGSKPAHPGRWGNRVDQMPDMYVDDVLKATRDEFRDMARANSDFWYH